MSLFKKHTLTVKRYATVSIVKGRHQKNNDTFEPDFNIETSIQPISGNKKLNLPENIREVSMLVIYPNIELRTTNDTTGLKADRINYLGKLYEVLQVKPWKNGICSHYECVLGYINDKS